MILEGMAWKVGDHIDTDLIIPARYLTTPDEGVYAEHCLEDLIPGFAARVHQGDVLLAGENFGCGSSREHAPRALRALGISAVIAASFARIFYRNAFNIGLPVLESRAAAEATQPGERVRVELAAGMVTRIEDGASYPFQPLRPFMLELISRGGLMNYLKQGGWQ